MPTRAFLDSNVFLFAVERPTSNSRRVVDLLAAGKLQGVVTDRIVREVTGYLRRHYGKDLAAKARDFILLTCELVLEADVPADPTHVDLVGRKDAGALAAVHSLGLARLVSTDSDFAEVPEHRTPRALLQELGQRPRPGDE